MLRRAHSFTISCCRVYKTQFLHINEYWLCKTVVCTICRSASRMLVQTTQHNRTVHEHPPHIDAILRIRNRQGVHTTNETPQQYIPYISASLALHPQRSHSNILYRYTRICYYAFSKQNLVFVVGVGASRLVIGPSPVINMPRTHDCVFACA